MNNDDTSNDELGNDDLDELSTEEFFAEIYPAIAEEHLDWDHAREITEDVHDRFADKEQPNRAMGIALRRIYGPGRYTIKPLAGKWYVVPRR